MRRDSDIDKITSIFYAHDNNSFSGNCRLEQHKTRLLRHKYGKEVKLFESREYFIMRILYVERIVRM